LCGKKSVGHEREWQRSILGHDGGGECGGGYLCVVLGKVCNAEDGMGNPLVAGGKPFKGHYVERQRTTGKVMGIKKRR